MEEQRGLQLVGAAGRRVADLRLAPDQGAHPLQLRRRHVDAVQVAVLKVPGQLAAVGRVGLEGALPAAGRNVRRVDHDVAEARRAQGAVRVEAAEAGLVDAVELGPGEGCLQAGDDGARVGIRVEGLHLAAVGPDADVPGALVDVESAVDPLAVEGRCATLCHGTGDSSLVRFSCRANPAVCRTSLKITQKPGAPVLFRLRTATKAAGRDLGMHF